MSIRGFCLLAAVLSLALIGAGCGSDDSATGADDVAVETGSLSKAEFIEKTNQICSQVKAQMLGEFGALLKEESENPAKPSEGSSDDRIVLDIVVPGFQKQIDEISALGAPAGDEQEVAAFLGSFQQVTDKAADDPGAFAASQTKLGSMPKLAKQSELTACTEPLSN